MTHDSGNMLIGIVGPGSDPHTQHTHTLEGKLLRCASFSGVGI